MRLKLGVVAASVLVAAFGIAPSASAQSRGPASRDKSNSQFALRRGEPGGPDGVIARQRARTGDCAGALSAFDAAIKITIEPTLRRDRGLCHEKLNHPFPAIDDFRYYLAWRPDAPDGDQIRERLARLEEQAGVGGPSSEAVREQEGDAPVAAASGQGKVRLSVKSTPDDRHQESNVIGPKSGEPSKGYDYYVGQEKAAEAAETSPLRYGSGFIIGPFVHVPRFFFGDGASGFDRLSYAVGGTVRYSTGPTVTLLGEVGYTALGDSGATNSAGGPLLFFGVEARVPISRYAADQIVFGGGLGFERYQTAQTKVALNGFDLRLRGGYRHIFGPQVGFEAMLDGGPVLATFSGVPSGASADSKIYGVLGTSFAFLLGF